MDIEVDIIQTLNQGWSPAFPPLLHLLHQLQTPITQGKSQVRDTIPSTFNCNGEQVVGDFNIANGFNEFFARVGPELARKFDDVDPKAFEQYLPPPHTAETFTFCNVTGEMVLKFLGGMQSKCSQGPDGYFNKTPQSYHPPHSEPTDTLF